MAGYRGQRKSQVELDKAKTFKTVVDALIKMEKFVPVEMVEAVMGEMVTNVSENLDTLTNKLMLAVNPRDKQHFATIVDGVVNSIKEDISNIKIDVKDVSKNISSVYELLDEEEEEK